MEKVCNKQLKEIINKLTKSNYSIYIFDEIKSTNTTLKSMAEQGAKEGCIVLARKQTEGRGTQGREFFSPLNGLYISMLVKPKIDAKKSVFLTVSTAVAVVNAIKKVLGIKCGIKWVNDIIYNNKKVGGILTEGGFNNSTNSLDYAVIGVGINLSVPKGGFPKELEHKAGALCECNVPYSVYCELIAEIINNTFKLYKQLDKKKYIKKYQNVSILKHKDICYKQNGKTYFAKVIGVDKDAKLVVKENGVKIKLSAGEVTFYSL